MTTQRVVSQASVDIWERHKAIIEKLYLEENKTLDEVMEIMNDAYGFVSAKSNYQRRIRRWKFRKNHAASEWKAVGQRVQARERDGKESTVYIDNRFVSPKKLQRKVSLYCSGSRLGIETSENPRDLEGIIIQTPPPEKEVPVRTDDLPFVQYDAALCTGGVPVPYRLHQSNDTEIQHNEPQIYMEQDSYQPGSFAGCIPPQIIDSLSHQHLAACHFQSVIPLPKPLLPSSATGGYSEDSSISIDSWCSTYMRLLVFSTANNFAGLDDFPLEYFVQQETHFQAAVNAGNDHVVEILLRDWATHIEASKQVFVDGDERYTALQRSCQLHHIAVTRVLLQHGANANQMIKRYGHTDWTALELAVGCHRSNPPPVPPELVLLLVESGASFGYKLLRRVVTLGHVQVLEILLHKLVQLNPVDLTAFGVFHKAIDTVDNETAGRIIDLMLQSNVDLNYGFPMVDNCNEKRYLIEIAAQKGNVDAVQKLFESGAIMTKDVLSYAVQSGVMALITTLLAQGANVDSVVTLKAGVEDTLYSTPLAESIRLDVPELTQLLQSKGALQRIKEERRFRAAIQAASEVGNVNFIRLLIDIDPDLRKFEDDYFLWHAVIGDHEEACVVLIDHGVRIQRDRTWARCALTEAVKRGRSLLVRKILNAEPEKRPDFMSHSPLPIAIKSGNISLIQDLIAAGTDVNAPLLLSEPFCQLPLSVAVEKDDIDLVAWLIKSGAQINPSMGLDSETALGVAVRTRSASMIHKLLLYGADPCDSEALLAAIQGNSSLVLLLLNEFRKRYPLGRPGYGVGALCKAIKKNDLDLIKLLLEHNVDASGYLKDLEEDYDLRVWKTPLAVAIKNKEGTGLQEVGLLLDAGVNPDSIVAWHYDSRKETPLLVAIRLKSIQMVKFLLNSGASVNFPANMGVKRTPLQQAAEVGDLAITQTLLSRGARINDAPAYNGGGTALQLAAIGGYVGIAELLLQAGADLNASGATVDGRTALEGAAEHGRFDMVKFLINCGALNAGDRHQRFEKAVRLAWNRGHYAVVDLLRSSLLADEDCYSHLLSPGPATSAIPHCDFNFSMASDDLFHRIREDGEDGDLPLDVVIKRLWG